MPDDEGEGAAPARSIALLATPLRSIATASFAAALPVAVTEGALAWTRSARTLASLWGPLALCCAAAVAVTVALLRAQEWRLQRELRTARKGTPVLRDMVLRGRSRVPLFARMLSTELGSAAVLLADGDVSAARDALAADMPWMHVGRVGLLRAFVLADAERASGTPAALDRCVRQIEAARPTGNREADLYRTHVLVKAVLERGDADAGSDIARRLAPSNDEDERVYAAWLRVWFDLDANGEGDWPALSDGQARLAALVARAAGAEELVRKLEARLVAIARPQPRE